MPPLSLARISSLVAPYLADSPSAALCEQLSLYLELLLRWNARTNLTAIREPEEIVRRHFGESLFCAETLRSRLASGAAVLDFGSGAGFPGLPMQLLLPDLRMTLAESQGKKAAFLREAVRAIQLSTEVWAARVEEMPEVRCFDCVCLRAVDNMGVALVEARKRVTPGGVMAVLGGDGLSRELPQAERHDMPGSHGTFVYVVPV